MLKMAEPARTADLIVYNGKIATQDEQRAFVTALAINEGRILATGSDQHVMRYARKDTKRIDLNGRTAIPGLNDSHLHVIRGGLSFNLELRWDGVPSLAEALDMLRRQVARTPAPHWVRVVGGWTAFQFAEKRGPTVAELNEIAPDTPVFILHLYDSALLNAAALRAVGYDRDTPNPPGGEIQFDRRGRPTGMLIARPNAAILYAALAKGVKLGYDDQMNSTRHFMRELNRLGVTSAIDAGGGYHAYPDDYAVIMELAKRGELTMRIGYNLFTQNANQELADFAKWVKMTRPGAGDEFLRVNGAGERLVFSGTDFEDFLEPRPDLPASLEEELTAVIRLLVKNRWPFRLHATYDESVSRFLDVFEAVNREIPFDGLRWFFDHCETISDANIARVAALGGGIAVQHRMAYQGEYFIARYGADAAARTPPVKAMLAAGLPVGAGTDATRVASYNPFVSLHWMISGRTVGGTLLYPERNRLDRMEALRRYTVGSAWFSGEEDRKGALVPGQYADFAVLSDDYFTIDEPRIKYLSSVLTVVDGKVVHADDEFASLAPPALPVSPAWSPVAEFGGYSRYRPRRSAAADQGEVAGIRIPRTPVAIEAAEAARASLPGVVVEHASRVFVLASLAARKAGYACDADSLYVAAMYANMGLSVAYCRSSARYELDSADAASAHLLRHRASQRVRDDVWLAVALHTTPGVPVRLSPLASVLASAVSTDLMALDLDVYTAAERDALLAAYPRTGGFRQAILEAIARGVAHRPQSTFGTWSADALERADPEFRRPNFCGLVLGADWQDR